MIDKSQQNRINRRKKPKPSLELLEGKVLPGIEFITN